MFYRVLADLIVIIHFLYVVFMVAGFVLTIRGFFHNDFFDRWIFRTIHLAGISFVSILACTDKYCPLTLWENALRLKYNPGKVYSGSFIVYYTEKFVYPDINPLLIQASVAILVAFTVVVYILKPPRVVIEKLRRLKERS